MATATKKPFTVGDLRAAIKHLTDDLLIHVCVPVGGVIRDPATGVITDREYGGFVPLHLLRADLDSQRGEVARLELSTDSGGDDGEHMIYVWAPRSGV